MKQLTIATAFVLIVLYVFMSDERQIEAQQKTIDSLQTELFNTQNNVGRYEIALELLSQENEPAAAKFDSLYKHETE